VTGHGLPDPVTDAAIDAAMGDHCVGCGQPVPDDEVYCCQRCGAAVCDDCSRDTGLWLHVCPQCCEEAEMREEVPDAGQV